jgi:hypothetical protein
MSVGAPTVTCVIIVYNGEAYLDAAITSVVEQSSRDWKRSSPTTAPLMRAARSLASCND